MQKKVIFGGAQAFHTMEFIDISVTPKICALYDKATKYWPIVESFHTMCS
jgi:hypothetical protein